MDSPAFSRSRLAYLAIAALLVGGATWAARVRSDDQLDDQGAAEAMGQLREVRDRVREFHQRYGTYPHGLETMVPRHLDRIPVDPWGRAYRLSYGPTGPVISSYGRDGKAGGQGPDQDLTSLELKD